MNHEIRKRSLLHYAMLLVLGLAGVVLILFVSFEPDRPVATIVPESSAGPAFVVQVVRPRLGLPLGGLLPPEIFGQDAHLGFDSQSDGAKFHVASPDRIDLTANDWKLRLVLDTEGRVSAKTEVIFSLVFEGRKRKVRCRPGEPAVGTLNTVALARSGELAGSFDIELSRCEDAQTGKSLGWPPQPLILRGSFDRLRPSHEANSTR